MSDGAPARLAAGRVVGRVLRGGAYSNVVIGPETAHLDDAGRRLAHFLSFATLRNLPRVDRIIAGYSRRGSIEPPVLDTLRVAVTELLVGSAPDYAIVDAAVAATRQAGRERAAGFVNGVLRSFVRHGEPAVPDGREGRALLAGHEPWLVEVLDAAWGEAETDRFLNASQSDAPLALRRRPGAAPSDTVAVPGIRDAVLWEGPRGGLPDGHVVQDPASVAVGWAVSPQAAERVLDVAAAPGGKSLHLWDQRAGQDGLVLADVHERRVLRARSRLERRGCTAPWVIADGRRPPFAAGTFDKILLDAPCTGLGTLRRRPEIRLRVSEAEVRRLAALQHALIGAARRLLAPGGTLVYSVCTVTPAETTELVDGLPARPPEGLPGEQLGNGLLMAPHLTGTDGMFISLIEAG